MSHVNLNWNPSQAGQRSHPIWFLGFKMPNSRPLNNGRIFISFALAILFSCWNRMNRNKDIHTRPHFFATRHTRRNVQVVNCELCAICGSVIRHQLCCCVVLFCNLPLLIKRLFYSATRCAFFFFRSAPLSPLFLSENPVRVGFSFLRFRSTRVRPPICLSFAESNDFFETKTEKIMVNITIKMGEQEKNKTCHTKNLWLIIRTTHDG